MASEKNLCKTVKDCLEKNGSYESLKASLRLQVLNILKDKKDLEESPFSSSGSEDNFIINQLIKEYLDWNNYHLTSSTLSAESDHPNQNLKREDLENALNLETLGINSKKLPLLYTIISSIKK